MFPRGWFAFSCVSFSFVGGCLRASEGGRYPAETISIPDTTARYSTEPQPDGAVGGKGIDELRAQVAAALTERGEHAEADGALGATASFALRELNQGRTLDLVALDAASRRFGFAGVLISTSGFDTEHQNLWREQLDSVARNVPITRYGICMSPGGHSAAVVYGAAELEFESIPRSFEPGQSVTLKGQVGSRFASSQLFLTNPGGKVDERKLAGRTFEVSFPLNEAGRYQLEVMGDGTTGPVVVSNIPLYVGIPEPTVTSLAGTAVEPQQAEARMLWLLNEARRNAGLNTLAADPELRRIALAHSEDMVEHSFFGHVSPTTGSPDNRIRRSGALVSFAGENVAAAPTPEAAYEGLMNSPGHRLNMLRPVFTHVGIGAEKSPAGITITLVFGRRPDPSAVPTTVGEVQVALAKLRAKQNVPEVTLDPVYTVSTQAGADQYANGATPDEAAKAIESTLIREVKRLHSGRAGGCTLYVELLELDQLSELSPLLQPGLRKLGIGARTRRDDKGTRLSTVFLLEGAPCK